MKKSVVIPAAALLCSISACSRPNPNYNPGETFATFGGTHGDDPTTGGDEEGVDETAEDTPEPPMYGLYWCTRAYEASYTPADDPVGAEPVAHDDGTAPEGCQCVQHDTDVELWLFANLVDDEVVIDQADVEAELGAGSDLANAILQLRNDIYNDTRATCTGLVPGDALDSTCLDADLFDADPATPEFEPTGIYRDNRMGESDCLPPPVAIGVECEFDDYVTQIERRDGNFTVPSQLVDGYLDNPNCLMIEGWAARVDEDGIAKLHGIQAGDALHRLGLRNGDIPLWVNAGDDKHPLATVTGAMDAVAAFANETDLVLEVERGGTEVQLGYHIER
ncbi:MAG: hypothetical protein AAF799_47320 [Myxococcota bacterium]